MLIRNMALSDIGAVVEIEKNCFSQPWSEKSFEDSIQRDDTIFLVCQEEANVMGYIGMYVSFDEASITNVAVSPLHRKKGCGEALILEAKKAAKERAVETIFLEVRVSNEPAISLYKKTNFQNLGIRKKFYEHPVEDAYIMSCALTDS